MRLQHPVNPNYVRVKGDWGSYEGHKGRDYGWISQPVYIPESREVRAAAPGKVVGVVKTDSYNKGWGRFVLIQHTTEAWTAYAHFAEDTITVVIGDIVQAGQLLGRMGDSGKTGTPPTIHLHFEVRIGGQGEQFRVPPGRYFADDLPGESVLPKPAAVKPSYPHKKVTLAAVNLRKSPKTGAIIRVIPAGTIIKTGSTSKGWTPVKVGRDTGWISAEFAVITVRKVAKQGLILRDRPTAFKKGAKVKARLKKGAKVTVLAVNGKDASATYWKVRAGLRTGWVHSEYLK